MAYHSFQEGDRESARLLSGKLIELIEIAVKTEAHNTGLFRRRLASEAGGWKFY